MSGSDEILAKYLNQLKKLRRAKSKDRGAAPHKPILLLAVIKGIEKGEVCSNVIEITPELVLDFKDIWSQLVITNHTANFALPFFHMKSEGFWSLNAKNDTLVPITSSNSIKSLSALKESLAFAKIDPDLFHLLINTFTREFIRKELLEFYFPETFRHYEHESGSYIHQLELQFLQEDPITYSQRLEELKYKLDKQEFEEEVFVRGGLFKKEVPKIYNYTCAVSGMWVETTTNAQMVDACHIKPFAISQDDTIRNGICLTPTLHRAFDRGLISIGEQYEVIVSSSFSEADSPYSIKQFEGKQIELPKNLNYFPLQQNLDWHRRETFIP
ncbi:MAG: HNH endonuclease [bacterium]|nr:HNH endonuclease [bacterium]